MKSRGPSHEVLYWRVALGLVGMLAPALIPMIAPRFPGQPFCLILGAVGFFAGAFFAGLYRRWSRKTQRAREREVWSSVWVEHPDCRPRSQSHESSGQ